jgi:hypothetical protein
MRAGFVAPRYLPGALIGAGGIGVILALAGINNAARGPLVLLFLVAAPAMAIAGLLRGLDTAARYIVAVTAAVVINMLVAETMLAAGVWAPRAGLVVIASISAVIGIIGHVAGRRSARRGIVPPEWAGHPQVSDGGIFSRT